jgi:hypothetical protein
VEKCPTIFNTVRMFFSFDRVFLKDVSLNFFHQILINAISYPNKPFWESIPAVTPRYCAKKIEKCSLEHKKEQRKKNNKPFCVKIKKITLFALVDTR